MYLTILRFFTFNRRIRATRTVKFDANSSNVTWTIKVCPVYKFDFVRYITNLLELRYECIVNISTYNNNNEPINWEKFSFIVSYIFFMRKFFISNRQLFTRIAWKIDENDSYTNETYSTSYQERCTLAEWIDERDVERKKWWLTKGARGFDIRSSGRSVCVKAVK